MSWRPRSILEIARRTNEGEDFSRCTREFVDELSKMSPSEVLAAIEYEPQGPWKSELHKPFLAAVAEHYGRQAKVAIPKWTNQKDCFLEYAHFGSPLHSLRAHLLIASPPAFSRRLIFVDRDPIPRSVKNILFEDTPKPNLSGKKVSIKY